MAVRIELVPIGPESQLFVVRLQQNDEVNELAPLSEAVAQHIADCLRIKLALDANTPLSDLALCRPMTEYEHMLDDLRSENLPDIMATLEAAAVEEAEGGSLHPEAGEASVDAPVAADGGSAVAGQQLSADASPKAAVPAETGAVAVVKQEAGSDQTEVHVQQQQQQQQQQQLATACRGNEHPPASTAAAQQTQRQQRRQSPTTPAQLAALSSDDGGKAGGALHAAGRAASTQPAVAAHEKDELLARKLQAQLVAAERYGSRTRRDAAPAQGSLQLPTSRNWPSVDPAAPKAWTTARRQLAPEGRGSAPPLSPTSRGKARLGGAAGKGPGLEEGERGSGDGEEEDEEDAAGVLPEFRGVVEVKLSGLSWLATLVAHLDAQELPVVGGKRWSGSVCECGSQKEAAVARDLALLWREQRLGFLGGDLAWQPEEYNFQLAGYHARVDVSPNLLRCRTLSDLRKLLASLHDAGTLADLAASLERNPLSCAAVQPTAEPYSAEAMRKLRGVGASQSDKLPWRAWLTLRPGQQVSLASFATAAQAAAAADMAVVWKQERHGKQGDLESQQYNFLLEWYRRDEAVWARLLAVDQEHDLRILFRKLRDCGWMERLVQQQKGAAPPPPLPPPQSQPPQQQPPLAGHSAELAAAAVTKPALRAKRKRAGGIAGSSAAQAAAERASGNNAMPGVAAAADKEAPAGKRNRVRKPATVPSAAPGKSRKTRPGVTASAAAGAAAGNSGAADEPPDHVPLLTALSSAAKTPDGRAAGLSVELAATYLPALSTRSAAQQRQQIGCLQLLLATREYAGVVAMLQAAIKIARLQ